jgi:hypothetical protein
MFKMGIAHIANNHFVDSHKVNQKIIGGALKQMYQLCFGIFTYEPRGESKDKGGEKTE